MKRVLEELFEILDNGELTPEEEEAHEKAAPWAIRLQQLTENEGEFDKIWGAAHDTGSAETKAWFVRGFRLGARAMLEVLEG